MIQTTASILRERIKKLNGKEFTAEDILYYDPYVLDHEAFVKAALSSLSKLAYSSPYGNPSEVKIIRTDRTPNGHKINVYKENKLKVITSKFKKELNGATIPKAFDTWQEVWPEMFNLPKFKNKRVGSSNQCLS